jgi:hypothetical protein
MKKLIMLAISSTILLWVVNVLVYYLFNYPNDFSLNDILINQVEWKSLLLIHGLLILIASVLSLVNYRKINFNKKFICLIVFINILATILNLSNGIYRYNKNKKELNELVLMYQQDAKIDIKNDKIKSFGHGLVLPPHDKKNYEKYIAVKSIEEKYGLYATSTCLISKNFDIAEEEYQKITNPYLEKRNRKFWKERMKKEIDSVLKN